MEKNIYTYSDSKVDKIQSIRFQNEKMLQDLLEALIKEEKKLLSYKIIGYKREFRSKTGRPDFILVDSEGRIIIVECKLIDNAQSRREVIAQLIDYASDYTEILKINDWVSLTGENVEVDIENSEPLLCIVCDNIHSELHRVNSFLMNKNFVVKLLTINRFIINTNQYFTITAHETEPITQNNTYIEKLNLKIRSFGDDSGKIGEILQIIKERFPNSSIKPGKKRIAIHINGSEEKFAIWLSQAGVRDIPVTNITIPKVTFEPCSKESYDKVITALKEVFTLNLLDRDDIMYYIEISNNLIASLVKFIESISDNIK